MRLNFAWINDPEVRSLTALNSRLFFTKDAESNGFKAAQEVMMATQRFVTGLEAEYKPLFARIRPVMGINSAGVILHKQLDFMDACRTENEKVDIVLELFEFLSFKSNQNMKHYSFLMAAEYFDYLQYRDTSVLAYAADSLIKADNPSRTLGVLWGPELSLASFGDFCLYEEIRKAVGRLPDGTEWLKTSLKQTALLKAYQTGAYPELKTAMTRKTRGKALESDLGL